MLSLTTVQLSCIVEYRSNIRSLYLYIRLSSVYNTPCLHSSAHSSCVLVCHPHRVVLPWTKRSVHSPLIPPLRSILRPDPIRPPSVFRPSTIRPPSVFHPSSAHPPCVICPSSFRVVTTELPGSKYARVLRGLRSSFALGKSVVS